MKFIDDIRGDARPGYMIALILATILLACLAIPNAYASGYDTVLIQMPDEGYAMALAGCMSYREPGDMMVFDCMEQNREPLSSVQPSSNSFTLAAGGPQFVWTGGECRMVNVTDHGGYRSYSIFCYDDEIFAGGMEADGVIQWP